MTATVALGPLMNDNIMCERDGLEREREGEREGLRKRERGIEKEREGGLENENERERD